MTIHIMRLISDLPASSRRVELCYNNAKTVCWLQLTNTEFIVDRQGAGFITVLIGAYRTPAGWKSMDPETANLNRDVTLAFGDNIYERVGLFQRAIVRSWAGFSHATAHRYAKGLTFGRDLSSPSFVMQALRSGFEAIGFYMPAYKGLRSGGFSVDDAIAYLQARARIVPAPVVDAALHEFEQIGPDPAGILAEDQAISTEMGDVRDIPVVYSNRNLSHDRNFAYAAETARFNLERVIGYGFRGDSRPPSAIRDAGGFNPNYTRPDHIALAEAQGRPDDRALDLERFLSFQEYGGYISVSKSIGMTKAFASNINKTAGGAGQRGGWVYACFVEGGFNIPKSQDATDFIIPHDEQEISMPGKLDWSDIVACRRVSKHGMFKGNLFIKRSFYLQDPDACIKVFELLSGRSQGKMPPPPVKRPPAKPVPQTPSVFLKKMFKG